MPIDARLNSKYRDSISIGLASCCIIIFQIAITRILSVVLWYHFAFLSISLAMLGLGLPGVWFSLFPPTTKSLNRALLASAISLPISVVVILRGAALLPREGADSIFIIIALASILIPMIALGSVVCLILLRAQGREIGHMYGTNLLGAVLGSVLVIPAMSLIATPLVLAGLGFIPLLILLYAQAYKKTIILLLAAMLVICMIWNAPFRVTRSKLYHEQAMGVLHEKWTPTGRITVLEKCPFKDDQLVPWGWGFGSNFKPSGTKQLWIDQDGSAGMPVEHPDSDPKGLEHLFFDVTSAGYQFRQPESAVIIGAGGGRDILTALQSGTKALDAVEINGAIVDALTDKFKEFSGDVYNRPGVNAVVSEGRSYLARSTNVYDLIQLSLVDSWAATAAGAFALSENYLYTMEAFNVYFDRLSDDGVLSITRFVSGIQQMEGARMAALCKASLISRGIEQPENHIAVIGGGLTGNFLVKKTPLAPIDLKKLRALSAYYGWNMIWPLQAGDEETVIARVISDGTKHLTKQGYDMKPPVDNRPFFFQSVALYSRGDNKRHIGFNEFAVLLLRRIIIGMGLGSVILFLLPFLLTARLNRHPGFWRGSTYFAATGLAFMLVEVPWIQRFILYLGHPSYAVAVVLGALLFGAGLGSMCAVRISEIRRAIRTIGFIPGAVVAVHLLSGAMFERCIEWPLLIRCISGFIVIVPAGFLMGFAFPVGIMCFGDENKAWFWAMTGIASVLASVVSLALAMMLGFSAVVMIAVASYVVAICMLIGKRPTEG